MKIILLGFYFLLIGQNRPKIKMKKIFAKIFISLLVLGIWTNGLAQTTTDDYKKNEFFVGYSHQRSEENSNNGFEVSAVRNFSRYFGIKGDFSAAFNKRTVTGSVNSGGTITTFPFARTIKSITFSAAFRLKTMRLKAGLNHSLTLLSESVTEELKAALRVAQPGPFAVI